MPRLGATVVARVRRVRTKTPPRTARDRSKKCGARARSPTRVHFDDRRDFFFPFFLSHRRDTDVHCRYHHVLYRSTVVSPDGLCTCAKFKLRVNSTLKLIFGQFRLEICESHLRPANPFFDLRVFSFFIRQRLTRRLSRIHWQNISLGFYTLKLVGRHRIRVSYAYKRDTENQAPAI